MLPTRSPLVHDSRVIAAAWEDDNASVLPTAAGRNQSIVVERTGPTHGSPEDKVHAQYDPFDEDDRLAQLPDDPFDDPFDAPVDDTIPESDAGEAMDEELDVAEDAVQDEIERRRTTDDLFEDDMEDALVPDTPAIDPLDELDDENRLSDDPEEEERLQQEDESWKTPDFGLDEPEEQELTPEELRQRSEELQLEREESEESCREELEKIEADTISSIDLSIRVDGNAGEDFPYECAVGSGTHQPRQWPQITYNWKAAAICHKPLYFEQVQLERYGHSWGPYVQPIMSGVHFFGTVPILPYKMGIRTPRECVYTLGYYRPGSCAPYMIEPIPFTWRAALFQTGVATGISFAIP